MADSSSFLEKLFGKKPKKGNDTPPPPAAPPPTPPGPAPSDIANGMRFLANPKAATDKRIDDAEKAAGMKRGGSVKSKPRGVGIAKKGHGKALR